MNNNILSISNVTVKFGGLVALNNFHINVRQGGISGVIGPNGAGKTTVFNIITGVYRPNSGSVKVNDKELIGIPTHVIAHHKVARTFQNIRLFANMSVCENIMSGACIKREGTFLSSLFMLPNSYKKEKELWKKANKLLEFCGLEKYKDSPAISLPYGMQRKLEIARSLMTDPSLLLLDEPAAGMNPTEKLALQELVKRISEQKISVLLIEHDMRFVMNLCENITVLNYGSVIAEGPPEIIQTNHEVIEAYLGSDIEDDFNIKETLNASR
ncbi:ABC transporter ATP-binding protein [Fluviispira multicolorata]|uniref:ATP-binding cassette domain-containing protein n=1 Tax=Fluviispira multicolorata TaxID=2654512 RepID=A0A833N4V7_9BACT|nr:ABC transporter ATP-binding protein [Fluviispira multicolorata]KAB8031838.1 ATP-binding cassette domain-containing protein [Fluviispira multicolorata]